MKLLLLSINVIVILSKNILHDSNMKMQIMQLQMMRMVLLQKLWLAITHNSYIILVLISHHSLSFKKILSASFLLLSNNKYFLHEYFLFAISQKTRRFLWCFYHDMSLDIVCLDTLQSIIAYPLILVCKKRADIGFGCLF